VAASHTRAIGGLATIFSAYAEISLGCAQVHSNQGSGATQIGYQRWIPAKRRRKRVFENARYVTCSSCRDWNGHGRRMQAKV